MLYGKRRNPRPARNLVALAGVALSACVGTIDSPRNWKDSPNNPVATNAPSTLSPHGTGVLGPSANVTPGSPAVPGAPGSSGSTSANGAPGSGKAPAACSVGAAPMRRLTHAEYNNAVRDLLGDKTQPASSFALDVQVGLFDNTAEAQTVPSLLADQYLDAATDLAGNVTDAKALLGCDPKGTTASASTCVKNWVTSFGRRAYRRPLTAEESGSLNDLYTTTKSQSDELTGVQAVVAAVLASPNFLFKPEFGGAASSIANAKLLAPYEQAARLASLLWASVPDDALLEAANSGQLATPAQIQTQARRMLADPKAKSAVAAFYDQWLGLDMLDSATKDAATYPKWNDDLRASMEEERRRFVSHVIWEDDARLETLLTANYSIVNGPLADLYGVSGGPRDAATYAQVMLDPKQRAGVLTQAAMLAAFARPDESSPVKRGKWVRVRMLCQDLPDPPANVPQLPAIQPGVSNRERFAMHTSNPGCSSCHTLIDGLGFGLEHYDSLGAYRDMDQGVPVDASGMVNQTRDIDGPYSGGPELANLLASSAEVRDCAPTQWMRYSMGRRETADDACSLSGLQKAFADSDGNLKELMIALTQTDTFLNYRQAD